MSKTTRILFGSVLFVLLLARFAPLSVKAVDPLDPSFAPAIDCNTSHYPANIALSDTFTKLRQDAGSLTPQSCITIYSTKNEFQSFQVHVHASSTISALAVTMSDLVNTQDATKKILASSTDIVVYREAYMHIQPYPSSGGPTFLWPTYDGSGTFSAYVPDILIPAKDPYTSQTTNAFPFSVTSGNNQSVWIDVHVSSALPSGYYLGSVTVKDGGTTLTSMPVVYAVWNWTMPSTATLPSTTALSYNGFCYQVYGGPGATGCGAYPGAMGFDDFGATLSHVSAAVLMLDNRYSLSYITNIYPGSGSFTSFDSVYGAVLDGTANTILPGAHLTNWSFVPLNQGSCHAPSGSDPQYGPTTFQNFVNHWTAKTWPPLIYQSCDEPDLTDTTWNGLITVGNAVHGFSTPFIPTAVTTSIVSADGSMWTPTAGSGALNQIDRFILNMVEHGNYGVPPEQDLSPYATWIAGNPTVRQLWSYGACSNAGTCGNSTAPLAPPFKHTFSNYNVDGTALANREMEWNTYLYGQTGELYYQVDHCFQQGGDAASCAYPSLGAANPDAWSNIYYSGGWGDGTLLYPGAATGATTACTGCIVGTTSPIWLPSMRVKGMRDGMQDYEYLHAVAALGFSAYAMAQVQSWVTNTYTYNTSPSGLITARTNLGRVLHSGALPSIPRAVTGVGAVSGGVR